MSQHKDKTTFFITKYLQELKRKRKVILCGIKAPCLSAGESLVCQRETKQLMIKLLPPQFKEIPTYQKLVIKYNLGIKECVISYQNQSLFGSQLVAKSLLYSSGQLGFFFFFWTTVLALIQDLLLINVCDYCQHSMHTITFGSRVH